MALKNKKVLITGSTGFIGANLTRKCIDAGAQVYIFTRAVSNKWRVKDILCDINEYDVDLLEYEKVKTVVHKIRPEIIFHTATYGGYPTQKQSDSIIQTNITGTMNLLNACSQIGFEMFVNTGSSSEYGIKDSPIKETDSLNPNSCYGIVKGAATLLCQLKAREENLPITTLRLFSPYGYYEDSTRLVASVIIACLKGENPKLSFPNSVRDFIFIEDVIEAYIKTTVQSDKAKSEIFNIGGGQQFTVREVVNTIVNLVGNNVEPEWGIMPNHRVEPQIWQADITKATNIFNWQPHYSLKEGLAKTIEWFRKNFALYSPKTSVVSL